MHCAPPLWIHPKLQLALAVHLQQHLTVKAVILLLLSMLEKVPLLNKQGKSASLSPRQMMISLSVASKPTIQHADIQVTCMSSQACASLTQPHDSIGSLECYLLAGRASVACHKSFEHAAAGA